MLRSGSTLLGVALSTFLVFGCQQADQTEIGEMEEPLTDILDEPGTTPEGTVQFDLEPVDNSGVSGVTRINHRADGSVELVVDLEGATEGTVYEGHLHRGTCEENRGELQALEAFTLSGAAATSTTVLPATTLDPNEKAYFVEVHAPAGTVVACSDMPQHEHQTTGVETGSE